MSNLDPDKEDDILDFFLSERSSGFFGLLWKGMILHRLLFYRQSALRSPLELLELSREGAFRAGKKTREPFRLGEPWSVIGAANASREIHAVKRAVESALRSTPALAPLYVLRGWICLERRSGSIRLGPAALANFNAAVRLDPNLAWAHASLGAAEESRRNFHGAISHLDRALELRPNWSWAYVLRGVSRWYFAQLHESIQDFHKAIELDPGSGVSHALLGRAKADSRDPGMMRDLNRAIRLSPGSGVFHAWRGRAHFMMGAERHGARDLSRAIRLAPDYDRGHSWRGVLDVRRGRFHAALKDLGRASILNPYYATTQYHLAQSCIKTGDCWKALKAMRAASRIDSRDLWEEHFTDIQDSSPAYGRAVEDMRELLERYPRESWLWAWLGQTQLLLKAYGLSLEALQKAVALNPRDVWAHVWRGETRRRLGLCRAAREDFDAALALDAACAWAYAGRGYCRLFLGQYKQAIADLDRALGINPRCGRGAAYAWRGEAHLRLGLLQEALADFKKALEFYPHWEWVKRWWAQAQGQPVSRAGPSGLADSTAVFDEAAQDADVRAHPYDRRAYVRRGTSRLRQGNCAGAIEDASRALETNLDPTDEGAILLRIRARRRAGDLRSASDELARLKVFHYG